MFQFLRNIYNYFFHAKTSNQANAINLYGTMKAKKFQRHNNKISKFNKYIYADNLSVYSVDYKKINDLYLLLQTLSNGAYDIICITNIYNELQTYNDGVKYVVIYTAQFIAQTMDMYYTTGFNCIILSRMPIHTFCTGIKSLSQCNATNVILNSQSRHSTSVEMGLEFSVSGTEKKFIFDELHNNYIQRITIYINDTHINIYNVNIQPTVFNYTSYTNTFVANLLEDNYNKIPCIITGIVNNSIYNWVISLISNNYNTTNINTLLSLNNQCNSTQFTYVNSLWCNQLIYIQNKIQDIYGIYTIIKINSTAHTEF